MKKMNSKWKSKWIAALTSGKYEQGDCYLQNGKKYCCLGVLRKLGYPKSRLMRGDVELLAKEHQDEFGLTYPIQNRLSEMNDGGKTFADIANVDS